MIVGKKLQVDGCYLYWFEFLHYEFVIDVPPDYFI